MEKTTTNPKTHKKILRLFIICVLLRIIGPVVLEILMKNEALAKLIDKFIHSVFVTGVVKNFLTLLEQLHILKLFGKSKDILNSVLAKPWIVAAAFVILFRRPLKKVLTAVAHFLNPLFTAVANMLSMLRIKLSQFEWNLHVSRVVRIKPEERIFLRLMDSDEGKEMLPIDMSRGEFTHDDLAFYLEDDTLTVCIQGARVTSCSYEDGWTEIDNTNLSMKLLKTTIY